MEDWELPCTCGHEKGVHIRSIGGTMDCCVKCEREGFFENGCVVFKLDNLKLVEDLAKERKLI